ncbi:DMT family transporter [Ruegeria sp. 2205SS24-7]|uniref:DMT family transporter n=1 Tax=Ruegeria discodermiae TaxID=3064389 RepID=UPI0027418AF9|nr:DMT family transporter [Ruegeria sp. 2205SS24-7]MDP5218117.1 DMT family transporter [Ruegeria sp. 2205SS24-7]
MDKRLLGIGLVALGSAFFASSGLFVQFTRQDASSWVAVFVALLTGGLVVVPFALLRLGVRDAVRTEHPGLLTARGLVSFLQMSTLFYAFHTIPLTDAVLFRQTAPLWVPILSALFLRERMPRQFWVVLLIGFIGVGLALHPRLSAFSIGYLVAILNGFLFAVQTLLSRRLNQLNEPRERILLYIYVIVVATTFGPAVATFQPIGAQTVMWLVIAGLLLLGSTGCVISGFKFAPAWLLSPVGYVAIVFGAFLDWLVLNQIPSLFSVIGIVMVIGSGVLIVAIGGGRHGSHTGSVSGHN